MFTDPKSESRSGFVYLPRDESFGHTKSSDFLVYILKSASQNIVPRLRSVVTGQFNQPEFNTFADVRSLYDGGIKVPTNFLSDLSPIPLFKELFRTDGESALKFVPPKVVQGIYCHTFLVLLIYIERKFMDVLKFLF
jgi:linoleate 9S-lipoxygenase